MLKFWGTVITPIISWWLTQNKHVLLRAQTPAMGSDPNNEGQGWQHPRLARFILRSQCAPSHQSLPNRQFQYFVAISELQKHEKQQHAEYEVCLVQTKVFICKITHIHKTINFGIKNKIKKSLVTPASIFTHFTSNPKPSMGPSYGQFHMIYCIYFF